MHDNMPYDLVQGQDRGHRGPKVAKKADFKVYLLCCYACNQKNNGDTNDSPGQYLNFNWTDF